MTPFQAQMILWWIILAQCVFSLLFCCQPQESWAKKGHHGSMHFGQQHVVLHPLLCDPIFRNEHRRRRRWWSLPNHIFTLYEPMVMPLKKVRKWRIIWQEFQKCPNLLQRQQRPKVVNLSKLDLVTSQWFKTIQFWKPLHFWISKKKMK